MQAARSALVHVRIAGRAALDRHCLRERSADRLACRGARDAEAREAYRRWLREVEADIQTAEANNDYGRASLARADREYLVAELARGVGLGGRARKVGEGAERARTAATRSVRYALDRIATHHPVLGEHLRRSVRTGLYFAYEPDPLSAVSWTA